MAEDYEYVAPLRKIAATLGFEHVLCLPLISSALSGPPHSEILDAWYHPDGIFFEIHSFAGWRVNDCTLSYNWRLKPEYALPYAELEKQYGEGVCWEIDLARTGSSNPCYDQDAACWWTVGDKKGSDTRRQLAYILACMRTYGIFRNPWLTYPFTLLSHYADMYDQETGAAIPWNITEAVERHRATTAERILLLPQHVRACIKPQ